MPGSSPGMTVLGMGMQKGGLETRPYAIRSGFAAYWFIVS